MEHFSFDREIPVTRYCRDRALVSGSNAWRKSLDWKRNAPKMAILTRKSKIFIKAKVIFMKSCLLGHVGFMIRCILNNFIFSNAICKKGKTFRKKCMTSALFKMFNSIKNCFVFLGRIVYEFFWFQMNSGYSTTDFGHFPLLGPIRRIFWLILVI